MEPRLCIDIDNVLARSDKVMRRVIRECTNERVNLRYEDIVEFDYCKCRDASGQAITKDEWSNVHAQFSRPDNIGSIEPFPGVSEHLSRLADVCGLHIVTARLPQARTATIEWLDALQLPPYDLHFLHHGMKHAVLTNFAAVVEDDYDQAVAFAEQRTPCFLLAHPWNKTKPHVSKVEWVKDWNELARAVLSLVNADTTGT